MHLSTKLVLRKASLEQGVPVSSYFRGKQCFRVVVSPNGNAVLLGGEFFRWLFRPDLCPDESPFFHFSRKLDSLKHHEPQLLSSTVTSP
eukprot:g51584.t1